MKQTLMRNRESYFDSLTNVSIIKMFEGPCQIIVLPYVTCLFGNKIFFRIV